MVSGGVGILGLLAGLLAFGNSGCGGLPDISESDASGDSFSISSGKYTAAAFFIFIAAIFKLSVGYGAHRKRFGADAQAYDPNAPVAQGNTVVMTSGFGQPMVGIQQPVNPFGGPVVQAQPVYPGQVQ